MRLLMHMCCGPCSVYPSQLLAEDKIDYEGFFYNPNIHPREEYERRRENIEKFSHIKDVKVNYMEGFNQEMWGGFKGSDDSRCCMCYNLRLERTAAFAAKEGFDAYTTTLLVSPYQKHELIKELGDKYARKYGPDFYYRDFRPGFRQGQQKAKEMELYRQKYCGCIISYNERESRKKK